MMLKRTPSDNRMIHFKQINLYPFISWRFKKNPFLSHLDSLPQTPYNKREKSIPRRVFEAIQMKREAGSNPAQQPLLYSVCVCHEPLKAISRRRRT